MGEGSLRNGLTWRNHTIKSPKAHRNSLWRYIVECTADPRTVELAAEIIDALRIPERDAYALVRGFLRYAQSIKFFREWPERHAAPWVTARWNLGDCDDKVVLFACLARAFRIPVRLVFLKIKQDNRLIWHVFAQVSLDGQWVSAETTTNWPLGRDLESIGIPVFERHIIGDSHARIQ